MTFETQLEFRKWVCKNCDCPIDKTSPCAECPKKMWPKFYLCEEKPQEHKPPSFVKMVQNFGSAIKEETISIMKKQDPISEEEAKNRIEICKSCEFFIPSSQRCMKCGCYMPIKTGWRSQKCPIGRW